MADSAALEVFRWTTSVVVPAVSGLVGVAMGAWLTARQDRRKQKREAYTQLLEALATWKHRSQIVLDKPSKEFEALVEPGEQLARVIASSLLFVNADARRALKDVDESVHGGKYRDVPSFLGLFDTAIERIVEAARRDLKRK